MRKFLRQALSHLPADPAALGLRAADLGCQRGYDTSILLHLGWRVLAVDSNAKALEDLRQNLLPKDDGRLEIKAAKFESLELPPLDFIYAGYSLPFCMPDAFPLFWESICNALSPEGVFAGQLFGPRDTWASETPKPQILFHERAEVEAMLGACKVLLLNEFEEDAPSFSGPKHWHVYDIIVRKQG